MRPAKLTISGDVDNQIISCTVLDPYTGQTYKVLVKYEAFSKKGLPVDVSKVYIVTFDGDTHDVTQILGIDEAESGRRKRQLAALL